MKDVHFVKGIRGTDTIMQNGRDHVAFLGRSNVGKSSLINYLTNRKHLVKSSGRPGKTTEINFFLVEDRYYLVDLPGYGYAKLGEKQRDKLRKLILWYLTEPRFSEKVVVLVIDARRGIGEYDRQLIIILQEQAIDFVIACNKIDQLNQKQRHQLAKDLDAEGYDYAFVSSIKKKGGEILTEKLAL
jgi:GTP-binding protein